MGDDASDDNFTVLGRNGSYFLTEDAEGYGIWPVRSDREDPVLTFPSGANGRLDAEAAFRREARFARGASFLVVTAVVSGGVYVVARVLESILRLMDVAPAGLGLSRGIEPFASQVLMWTEAVLPFLFSVFTVSVGLFVVLWLHHRTRREA